MSSSSLTGAQKSRLRSLGQRMEPALKLGKNGLTPAFHIELRRYLSAHELVKIRFVGIERDERADLCEKIANAAGCQCVGSVGHTALFYLANPEIQKEEQGHTP